jgi:dipeptidyl aminopeptidase/acylaminoacyl peptidase
MRTSSFILVLACAHASACAAPARPSAPPSLPASAVANTPPSATTASISATTDPDVPSGADALRDADLAKRAEALIDAYGNSDAVLSRDGHKVIFISNRDGLPQLYLADASKPDSAATRLLATTDRVSSIAATTDGKSVVFKSDHGAGESWNYFKIDLDGKNLAKLEGESGMIGSPFMPSGKPDTMFYAGRKMSDPASTLWMLPLRAGSQPKKVYADPGLGGLFDVSKDGKWAAWRHALAPANSKALLIDISNGSTRLVYPTTGEASIDEGAISFDGRRFYVATDAGGEQSVVLAFDTATLREVARYVPTPPTATFRGLLASRRANLIAVNMLVGSRSEIRLLDGATLKPTVPVTLPLGFGDIESFSDDGRYLTISWSTPEMPSDAFRVDVRTGAVSPLRTEMRPSLRDLPRVEAEVVKIEAHDGLQIETNVYRPAGAAGKKLPVIVRFHGGPYGAAPVQWNPMARFFLGLGYAWVEPNVRGSVGYGRAFALADDGPKRADAFKDVETVGRWVAAQPWADQEKLVVLGESYGGYTTLIALTRQRGLWRAGVDLFGIANLRSFMSTTTGVLRELFKTEFGDPEKDAALLDAQSPIRDVDKISAPLFVYAGANDARVPRSESDQIVKALRERKVPVEYMVAPNEGHSMERRETRIALFSRVARFLASH